MSLQTRLEALATAIGADIKALRLLNIEAYTFSMAGTLSTKVGAHRIYTEAPFVVESVRASVGTAPSGGSVVVDVNRNGSSIYGNQINRPTILSGAMTAYGSTASNGTFALGDYITVDIDTITAPAADLTVVVRLRRV